MLFQHTRRCQCVSIFQPASISRPNSQLVAVEKRSRQSCLDVLHSFRLELIFGLELFRRLIAQTPLALLHYNTFVTILSQLNTYEFLPPAVPENVSNYTTMTSSAGSKHSRSSLALRHTGLNSLNLSRPETSRSSLVLRPGNARWAYGSLEVIDGRRHARSAFPWCRSCVG